MFSRFAYGIEIPTEIYELEDMQTIIKESISLVDLLVHYSCL